MPAQTATVGRAFYGENDRYPFLRRQLLDGAGDPIYLGEDPDVADVKIYIAPATWDHFLSPPLPRYIVDGDTCIVEDQGVAASVGYVQWAPGEGALSPPGTYHYYFKIFWSGGTLAQTIPPNTYETLIVRAPVGG